MPSISKFKKNNDGVSSMFLIPKRMYESLLNLLDNDDEETKNEIIALNQNQINNSNNYIENAIKYRNLQNLQKSATKKPDFINSSISRENLTTTRDYQLPPSLLQQQTVDYSSPFPNMPMSEMITPDERQPINDRSNELGVEGAAAVETSTPLRPPPDEQYRNSPIFKAINEPNALGKRVCPFDYCKRQNRDVPSLAKHLLAEHASELGTRERKILSYSTESSQNPIKNLPQEKTLKKTAGKKSGAKVTVSPLRRPRTRAQTDKDSPKRRKLFPSSYPKLK